MVSELQRHPHTIMPPPAEVWTRYLDITLDECITKCSGRIRSEYIPRSRLSIVELTSAVGEAVCTTAMRAMMSANTIRSIGGPSSGASSGLTGPLPATVPDSMFLDDAFPDIPLVSAHTLKKQWDTAADNALNRLLAMGFDRDTAMATLRATDFCFEDAAGLLQSRERLRTAGCPFRPRLMAPPKAAPEPGPPPAPGAGRSQHERPAKALADSPANPPDLQSCRSSLVDGGDLSESVRTPGLPSSGTAGDNSHRSAGEASGSWI